MEVGPWQEGPELQHRWWVPRGADVVREPRDDSFRFGICWVYQQRVEAGAKRAAWVNGNEHMSPCLLPRGRGTAWLWSLGA